MKAHLKYLSYVVRHKWYVFRAGLKIGVPFWRLIIHDWSKFLPSEWFPYVAYFYGGGGVEKHAAAGGRYDPSQGTEAFNTAWLFHQHRNPHHWQHWILREDDGDTRALRMPDSLVREMVADWTGAGLAQGHGWDVGTWYEKNEKRIILHPDSQWLVLSIISRLRALGAVE